MAESTPTDVGEGRKRPIARVGIVLERLGAIIEQAKNRASISSPSPTKACASQF
ncbi:MAG TPA: hypothetical protein VGH98_24505 [Gemmatimonadaceae bacterium]